MSTYAEKLKDPRWQKKRLEILNRDKFTCQACNSTDNTLNVHHKSYKKGKSPWEYAKKDLITFCESCHEKLKGKPFTKINTQLCNGKELRLIVRCGNSTRIPSIQNGKLILFGCLSQNNCKYKVKREFFYHE